MRTALAVAFFILLLIGVIALDRWHRKRAWRIATLETEAAFRARYGEDWRQRVNHPSA